MLQGISSKRFQFESDGSCTIADYEPSPSFSLLHNLTQYGTYVARLEQIETWASLSHGLIFQGFTTGISKQLQYYRTQLSALSEQGNLRGIPTHIRSIFTSAVCGI